MTIVKRIRANRLLSKANDKGEEIWRIFLKSQKYVFI